MGQPTALVEIETTFENEDEAATMLGALLESRRVACGHIHSFRGGYWWEGKIQSGKEYLLIMKTLPELRDRVFAYIRAHHSYDVPMIIAREIKPGDVDEQYLAWAHAETIVD